MGYRRDVLEVLAFARAQPGAGTRKRGLDRATNKALLLEHLRVHPGSKLDELCDVLPHLSDRQVQRLLAEMKAGGVAQSVGRTKAGRWFAANPG